MIQNFNEYLVKSSASIPTINFILNLAVAILLSFILSKVYAHYGKSLSNRRNFGENFHILTVTTMFIITIIKTSLALSLGLVGALSIIRFRTAIKEPEELTYLFIAISIGLGIGANQLLITLIAFFVIIGVIVFKHKRSDKKHINTNLQLILHIKNKNNLPVEKVLEIFNLFFEYIFLQRLEEKDQELEISLLIEAKSFSNINEAKKLLQENDKNVHITFMQNEYI
tara:strand:+ start:812 stop:1489 length:678 start_codon:yes stop_codon:yes gene_type:complete